MQQESLPSNGQKETQHLEQPPLVEAKPLYQSPRIVVFGTIAQLTRGSGGAYDDECTSGKQPGDDE